MIRKLLGIGLSAKLHAYKAKYANSYYTFDDKHIVCRIQSAVGKYYFSAHTYCDSPHEGGFGMSDVITIYRSRPCLSEEEANAQLVKEVRSASKAHSDTHFYRMRINGSDDDLEEYQSDKWVGVKWNGWSRS